MNLQEWLFLIQLLVIIIISCIRLFNIMTQGDLYNLYNNRPDLKMTWIFSITILFFWVIGLISTSIQQDILFSQLFRISTFLLLFNGISTVIEIFLVLGNTGTGFIKQHNSKDFYKFN